MSGVNRSWIAREALVLQPDRDSILLTFGHPLTWQSVNLSGAKPAAYSTDLSEHEWWKRLPFEDVSQMLAVMCRRGVFSHPIEWHCPAVVYGIAAVPPGALEANP